MFKEEKKYCMNCKHENYCYRLATGGDFVMESHYEYHNQILRRDKCVNNDKYLYSEKERIGDVKWEPSKSNG